MEVTDGNDGALAAGIAVAAMMQLFVRTRETSHVVGTKRAHTVLNSSPQENALPTIYQGASGREKRYSVPPTKLLLGVTEQLLAQSIFPVETRFPSQALGAVQL